MFIQIAPRAKVYVTDADVEFIKAQLGNDSGSFTGSIDGGTEPQE